MKTTSTEKLKLKHLDGNFLQCLDLFEFCGCKHVRINIILQLQYSTTWQHILLNVGRCWFKVRSLFSTCIFKNMMNNYAWTQIFDEKEKFPFILSSVIEYWMLYLVSRFLFHFLFALILIESNSSKHRQN